MKLTRLLKKPIVRSLKSIMFTCLVLIGMNALGQSTAISVDHFEKVIISPHIQVTFVEGDKESVTVESNKVSNDKLNIKVKGNTLHIYLDDARIASKSEKYEDENWKRKCSIYQGTIVTATVTYKTINELSLRGDETFVFKDHIDSAMLRLKIYGESKTYFNHLDLVNLNTTIYGESYLEIKKGSVIKHKMKCYGECEINIGAVNNEDSKITAFGEGKYYLNVSDYLKVTAYGEAVINYKGNPEVSKGIILGEAKIKKIN